MKKDNDTLARFVARLMRKKRLTLSIAESCTGGLLTHKITNIPGVSSFLKEGLISYSNESKIKRLNIPGRILRQKGAVSPEVAALMARNVTRAEKTKVGLAITGIAGPSGGTPKKPVGLVYIGLHYKGKTVVKEYCFVGNRRNIKERAALTALNMLRLCLIADRSKR